jgi:8-oxo-dGTP pyrophosphatase MutT (NUDIX family)
LFLAGDSALFLRRGNGGDHPNEWCFPGGQLEQGETAEAAAVRETWEETGVRVDPKGLRPWTRTVAPAEAGTPAVPLEGGPVLASSPDSPAPPSAPSEDVDFVTYCVRLKEQFTPTLDLSEHDGYAWAPVTAPPEPLHPGCRVALERLGWDELGVARAMAAGRLSSPQRYENIWLFAIRITGTGIAYRHSRKEFVWRDPAVYLNDEFLARCNGLAVIWEHPEKSLLNGKEFTDRAIGSVMLPYLRADRPDEVWAIAKIQDEEAARDMDANPMSTSPAVNFADPTENDRIKLDNGKVMLIEGRPSLLDHIAICPHGVWDKMGDPTGVESVNAEADAAPLVVPPVAASNHNFNLLRAHAAALALKAALYSARQ